MIYAILVWSILIISTTWMIYESVLVNHLSLNDHHLTKQMTNSYMTRIHAKALLVLILLWWSVYLIVNIFSINHTAHSMDLLITTVMMTFLTPFFLYVICYAKHRMSRSDDRHFLKSCSVVEWTLNILTALIYASIVNYSIQMIFILS